MIKSGMILAAGLGQRMRPITATIPKPLIAVARKTMLERAFEHFKNLQISNLVVNTHYLAPLIERKVKEIAPTAHISHEDVLLETGGGIKKALPLLGADPFFTLNGDMVFLESNSLKAMERVWDLSKMDALLLLLPREKAHGYEGKGDFFMSSEGRLSRPEELVLAPYVYIGVQITHPGLFKEAPKGPFSMNILWNKALEKGRLYGLVHHGEWFHISTPQDLEKYDSIINNLENKTNNK